MKRIFTIQLIVMSAFVVIDTTALAAQFQLIPSSTGGYGVITAMSADGNTIVGSDSSGNSFVWTSASGSKSLGLIDALPLAVSPSGDAIVGLMGAGPTAFQIVKNVFSSLPNLPGGANASGAYGVSRVKTGTVTLVVGQGTSTAGNSASIWTGPSSINALSLPSGTSLPSIANDITPYADFPGKRVIAGTANDVSGVNHAVKWTGALQTPSLLDSNPSEALALNSDGNLIAGQSNGNATIWQTGQSPITMNFPSQFDGVIGNSSHVVAVGTERGPNRYGFVYDSLKSGSQKYEIVDSILIRLNVLTSLGLNNNPGSFHVSAFAYAGSSSGNQMLAPNVVGISSNGKVIAGNALIDSSGCGCFFSTAWRLVLEDPYLDPRIGDFVVSPFTSGAYTFLGTNGGGTWLNAGNRKYVLAQTDGTTDFTALQFPGFLDAQFIVSDGINGDTEVPSGSLYTFPVPVTEFTYRLSSGVLPEEGFPIFLKFTDEFVSEFSLQSVPEPFLSQLAMVGFLALCRCRIHRKSSMSGRSSSFVPKSK